MEENQNNFENQIENTENVVIENTSYNTTNEQVVMQQGISYQESQVVTSEPQIVSNEVQAVENVPNDIEQEKQQEVELPPVIINEDKIVVKTELLRDALRKTDVVASKNSMLPITEAVMFTVTDKGELQLKSTDKENMITVTIPTIESKPGIVITLKIALIKSLLDKTTTEVTTFVVDGSNVKVISNGEYNIAQFIDLTTNEVIRIPDVEGNTIPFENTKELDKDLIMPYLEATYSLIASKGDSAPYSAIYFGDLISSTTGSDATIVQDSLMSLFGTTAYIKLSTVKSLISIGVGDKVNIGFGVLGNGIKTICFYTNNYRLYAVLKEGEEDYPSNEISNLLDAPSGNAVKVNKNLLLGTIDRLTLFYNSGVQRQILNAEFNAGKLKISNENKAFEVLPIQGTLNATIDFDIKNLIIVLKALKSDEVTICPILDGDSPIRYVKINDNDKVNYIISTAI